MAAKGVVMALHFLRASDRLKTMLLELGALAEESVRRSVRAIEDRDSALAKEVVAGDAVLDEHEVLIEEEGLKILALHQPVAGDLRFVVATLKINSDLERIGDMAVNIAERAVDLCEVAAPPLTLDFAVMADRAQRMLQRSLDALVNHDIKAAREVCAADDEVDALKRQMVRRVKEAIVEHAARGMETTNALLYLLNVTRHLERIADHATNIAEDVIYMIEGRIVRHRAEKAEAKP
jgi:phosphate transport system protein